MPRLATAILISGRGSNMLALIKAAAAADYPLRIVLVVANVADAPGLALARQHGVEAIALPHRGFSSRAAFEDALTDCLDGHGIQLVALAGFMRILGPGFVRHWRGRLVNIHPSLLPNYPGLHTHQRAIDAGDREAGCTVHLVTEGLDSGPILGQARVPVQPGDTAETLAARVLVQEHQLFPAALAAYGRGLVAKGESSSTS